MIGYLVSCKLHNRLVKGTVSVTLMIQQGTVPKLSQKYGETYRQGCIWIIFFFSAKFSVFYYIKLQ